MKKYSAVSFLFLLTLSVQIYATNAANMIALTPAASAMGGVGIALDTGVESIIKNPALMMRAVGPSLLIGANVIDVDLKSRVLYDGALDADTGYVASQAKRFYLPNIGYVIPFSSDLAFGVGLFGTSGFGIDHRNQSDGGGILSQMSDYVLALKLVPSVAYKMGPVSLGLSNHLTYGLLSFGAVLPDQTGNPSTAQQRGSGLSDALSGGIQGGITYDINPNWTVGATYQTPVMLSFRRAFDFDRDGSYDDLKVELPSELGVGVATRWDRLHLSFDIKQIYWSNAKLFKDLFWRDQTVVSLGGQYQLTDQWVLRAGYSYAPSVIENKDNLTIANGTSSFGGAQFLDSSIAFFNMVGLGGVVGESTITVGAGYSFTPKFKVDLSLAYGLENKVSQSGKTTLAAPDDTDATYAAKVNTFITAVALVWSF